MDRRKSIYKIAGNSRKLTKPPYNSHTNLSKKPDYRVDIFSVFKKNDLDIELDGTKPSFAERRRIQVPVDGNDKSVTISATIATTNPDAAIKKWPTPQPQLQQQDGNSITSHSTAPVVASKKLARTKTKGNKRQIRLGQAAIEEDIPIPAAAAAASMAAEEENNKKHVHRLADLEEAVQQEQVKSRRAASVRSRRSKKGTSAEEKAAVTAAALSGESTKKSSEAFRKKIEAMRKEAGTEWLRVLQEMDVVKKTH